MVRKAIILLAALLVVGFSAMAVTVPETLNYKVMYKWGLVNKQAGTVKITTKDAGSGKFKATLTAKSDSWADTFFKVRDTLNGVINTKTLEPYSYEKISHEGGSYKRDVIKYTRSGQSVTASCERWKAKKEKDRPTKTTVTHQANGFGLDMLSAFYYMRSLDYASMKSGQTKTMNIFSGKRKEILTITYLGEATIDVEGTKYKTYHISFKFTGKGGKETSDRMDAWMSTGGSHIPLLLEGKLPVGKVKCVYVKK